MLSFIESSTAEAAPSPEGRTRVMLIVGRSFPVTVWGKMDGLGQDSLRTGRAVLTPRGRLSAKSVKHFSSHIYQNINGSRVNAKVSTNTKRIGRKPTFFATESTASAPYPPALWRKGSLNYKRRSVLECGCDDTRSPGRPAGGGGGMTIVPATRPRQRWASIGPTRKHCPSRHAHRGEARVHVSPPRLQARQS